MEKSLTEEPNVLVTLLEQGERFARNGQLDKSFSAYSNAFRIGVVPKECITSLVSALVEFQRNKLSKDGKDESCSQDASSRQSMFSCEMCNSVFMKPVTLDCGHTFCEVCITEENSFTGHVECSKCGRDVSKHSTYSVNVLVMSCIQKSFPKEYQRQVVKMQGHERLVGNDLQTAIKRFTEILSISPDDFHCLCWRSDALLRIGRSDLALKDIEQASKLRPNLARTFYRKAIVLANLAKLEGVLSCKHEESVLALLRCSALSPRSNRYRQEFTQSLHQLLSPKFTNSNRTLLVLKLGRADDKELSGQDMKHFTPHLSPRGCFTSSNQNLLSLQMRGKSDRNPDVFTGSKKSNAGGELKKRAQKSRSFLNDKETSDDQARRNQQVKKPESEIEAVGDVIKEKVGEVEDFECKLCYSLLFQPITTVCGHTFCRECLERCLDHRVECPCCRSALDQYNRGDLTMEITEVLDVILAKYFTAEYNERMKSYQEKMETLMRYGIENRKLSSHVSLMVVT